jgi:hypothetical protein
MYYSQDSFSQVLVKQVSFLGTVRSPPVIWMDRHLSNSFQHQCGLMHVNVASDAAGSTRRFQGHDLPPPVYLAICCRRLVLLGPRSMDWWVRVHGTISHQHQQRPWSVKKTTRRSQSAQCVGGRTSRTQGQSGRKRIVFSAWFLFAFWSGVGRIVRNNLTDSLVFYFRMFDLTVAW